MKPLSFAVAMVLAASSVSAAVVDVSGPMSSLGGAPSIIAAPAMVEFSGVTNTAQQGFDEAQDVTLPSAIATDQGTIRSGRVVDSHMIFFNKLPSQTMPDADFHQNVVWRFDKRIIGVMSDEFGALEFASTPILGAPGTTYQDPIRRFRGMEERGDFYMISGKTLDVTMTIVPTAGDWIRVVTSEVPVPAAFPMLAGAIAGLGLLARRRTRA